MPRAILVVMDSVGSGGAPDAADFNDGTPTRAPTRSATSRRPAPRAAPSDGRTGPLRLPNLDALGLGAATASPPATSRRASTRPRTALWGVGREVSQGQGHPLRPLGNRRRAGALRLGLLPARPSPAFPPDLIDRWSPRRRHCPASSATSHASGTAIIAELGEEHIRDRQADLLHLRRQRASRSPRTRRTSASTASTSSANASPPTSSTPMTLGRVIARPFVGETPATSSAPATATTSPSPPPEPTLLDRGRGRGPPRPRHRQDRRHLRRCAASPTSPRARATWP